MVRCPQCGNAQYFAIQALTYVPVSQDTTGFLTPSLPDADGMEWDDDSLCTCAVCSHADSLITFTDEDDEKEAHTCPHV